MELINTLREATFNGVGEDRINAAEKYIFPLIQVSLVI
jgi:hypothetical protein